MRRRWIGLMGVVIVLAGCRSTGESVIGSSPDATVAATPHPSVTAGPTPETASPSVAAPTPAVPPSIYGTWRATFTGQALSLTINEDGTYRTALGSELAARGRAVVNGDEIVFTESTRCPERGVYRWEINDGYLTLFVLEEGCEGRAEGFNVRYGDYSPPR